MSPIRSAPIPFRPFGPLRNALAQTILASSRFRAWGPNPMVRNSRPVTLAVEGGVRLLGSRSSHAKGRSKGLVILLHGWEGSIDSTYMRCTGRTLFSRGYDIFRLNFRDHGQSHHLNPGLFYAVLLDEIHQAVRQVAESYRRAPVFLMGFSLGGNFVLRIMKRLGEATAPCLHHAIAVSPVLNPQASTARVDDHPLIRRYFLNKWRRSLAAKSALFPHLYDFSGLFELSTVRAVTERLLERYSDFDSAESYFDAYAVRGDDLKCAALPATIIVAADDPIIPPADFHQLSLHPNTRLVVHPFGGHNGFLHGWRLQSWCVLEALRIFEEASTGGLAEALSRHPERDTYARRIQ